MLEKLTRKAIIGKASQMQVLTFTHGSMTLHAMYNKFFMIETKSFGNIKPINKNLIKTNISQIKINNPNWRTISVTLIQQPHVTSPACVIITRPVLQYTLKAQTQLKVWVSWTRIFHSTQRCTWAWNKFIVLLWCNGIKTLNRNCRCSCFRGRANPLMMLHKQSYTNSNKVTVSIAASVAVNTTYLSELRLAETLRCHLGKIKLNIN